MIVYLMSLFEIILIFGERQFPIILLKEFDWGRVETFIAKFDFIYFDMKCLDAGLHLCVTGCGNGRIQENLTRLAELDPSRIIVTIPVILGVNTSEKMIGGIAEFCKKLNIVKMRLLPYHPFGEFKYNTQCREYLMARNLSIGQPELERYRTVIVESGIDCWIEEPLSLTHVFVHHSQRLLNFFAQFLTPNWFVQDGARPQRHTSISINILNIGGHNDGRYFYVFLP